VGVFNASTSPPKERYAVTETNVVELTQPGTFSDPLTEVLRNGAEHGLFRVASMSRVNRP